MGQEILINVTPRETRVALVEAGVLEEISIERGAQKGWVGSVYKGKVCRVLPGMQAAFLDIGAERTAFLHASDVAAGSVGDGKSGATINQLLSNGQEVLVQVVKEPLGTKGARLTTQISIPSRYLVFMPGPVYVGVSQKIEDEAERQRLKEFVRQHIPAGAPGGYILRTAAEGATDDELVTDIEFLQNMWGKIQSRAGEATAGTLVYEGLRLVQRTMLDLVGSDIDKVRVDDKATFEELVEFARQFMPELLLRIEYFPDETPLFDVYSVEDEIKKALSRKVSLKSGGYLVIDQREAMTTVDVNTGAFVGRRNLEETIFKTNLEATQTIARQLRLRNLGGIIILDFIDMEDEEHKRQVLRALEKAVARDRARTTISEITSLGLVEMTRKRTRESLEHVLCETCPTCEGRGTIKTPETVCYEIFREILREARQFDVQQYRVIAAHEVVELLTNAESGNVTDLERFIGKPIKVQVEPMYTQEQFDVVPM